MEAIRYFSGKDNARYEVPDSELDQFRASVPDARPSQLYADGKGGKYFVPDEEASQFQSAATGAVRVFKYRDSQGKYEVPEPEHGEFQKMAGLQIQAKTPVQGDGPAKPASFISSLGEAAFNTAADIGTAIYSGTANLMGNTMQVPQMLNRAKEAVGIPVPDYVKRSEGFLADVGTEAKGLGTSVSPLSDDQRSISERWKQGDKAGAIQRLALMAVENVPQLAQTAYLGGASLPLMGLQSAAGKVKDLDEANPQMGEGMKLLNAALTGTFEAGSEAITLGWLKRAFPAKAQAQVAKSAISKVLNMVRGPAEEGISEGASQLAQNLTDMAMGVKNRDGSAKNWNDGVADAAMSGAVLGLVGTIGAAGQRVAGKASARQQEELTGRIIDNYERGGMSLDEMKVSLALVNPQALKQYSDALASVQDPTAPGARRADGSIPLVPKAPERQSAPGIATLAEAWPDQRGLGGEVARFPGQQPGTVDITLRTGAGNEQNIPNQMENIGEGNRVPNRQQRGPEAPLPVRRVPAGANNDQGGTAGRGQAAQDAVTPGVKESFTTQNAVEPPIVDVPVKQVRNEQIAVRPELMQFKQISDPVTGATEDHKNTVGGAKYDDVKGGNILLWEPLNPAEYGLQGNERYILADGHGRMNFARSLPEGKRPKGFNTQILMEADGVSASDAMVTAALRNIADGKGTVYDQAKALRNIAGTRGQAEAENVARAEGIRGRIAAKVAFDASDNVYTAFINEKITGQQAATLAEAGAGDAAAQQFGLKFALDGKDGQELKNMVEVAKSRARQAGGPQSSQLDLFGQDDTAIREMEQQAARATKFQRQLDENIRVLNQALNRGGKLELTEQQAAALGITDRNNRQQISDVRQSLNIERERWEKWAMHPDLVERVMGRPQQPDQSVDANKMIEKQSAGRPSGETVSAPAQQAGAASSPTPGTTTDSNAQQGENASEYTEHVNRLQAAIKDKAFSAKEWVAKYGDKRIPRDAAAYLIGRQDVMDRMSPVLQKKVRDVAREAEKGITPAPGSNAQPGAAEIAIELMTPEEYVEAFKNSPRYKHGIDTEASIRAQHKAQMVNRTARVISFGDDGKADKIAHDDLNAAAVDAYKIELPEGYVRDGDRYVFKGEKAEANPPELMTPDDVRRNINKSIQDGRVFVSKSSTVWGPVELKSSNGTVEVRITDGPDGFGANPHQGESKHELIVDGNIIFESEWHSGRAIPDTILLEFDRAVREGDRYVFKGEKAEAKPTESFSLQQETPADVEARRADEERKAKLSARDGKLTAPMQGTAGDLGQMDMFPNNANTDLFNAPTTPKRSSNTAPGNVQVGSGSVGNFPGGAGGSPGSGAPSDGVAPSGGIKLPELWRLMTQQNEGNNPWVVKKKMRGDVLGRARLLDEHSFSIELLAKNARLTTAEEDAALQAQAMAYAEGMSSEKPTQQKLAKKEYDRLRNEVVLQRLDDPLYVELRFRTAAHEAVHAMDMQGVSYQQFLKDNTMVEGGANTLKRGNILGHVGGMIHFLKTTMPKEMGDWDKMLTPKERSALRSRAKKLAGVGAEPDAVTELYRDLLNQEYKDRGLVKRETVFDELESAILWFWENKALRTGVQELPEYFRQPKEMFAEAGAWLILEPHEMAKRAPEFYQLFTNWRRARPEWDRGMKHIISELESGNNQDVRHRERTAAMKRADDAFVAKRDAMRVLTPKEKLDLTISQFYNSSAKLNNLVRDIRKRDPEAADRIDEAMRRHQYHSNAQYLYASKMKQQVIEPLQEAGITREDFNLFLEDRRNRQGRAELFNPGGETPISAQESMNALRERLGPDGFKRMEDVATRLWEIRRDYALPFLDGVKSHDLMEFLRGRDAYTTVNVQTLDEDLGEWLLTASTGPGGGFAIRRAHGTMKDSMSPDVATLETDMKMIEYGLRQRFARAIHEAVVEGNLPHEMAKRVWNADKKRWDIQELGSNPHFQTIKYELGGQMVGVNVPRVLANMLEDSIGYNGFNGPMIRGMEKAIRTFKGFVTKWAPGFALYTNRAVDYGSYKLQMPGFNPAFRKYAPQANEAAISIFRGEPNALAEMLMRDAPAIIMRQGSVDVGADPLTAFFQRVGIDHHAHRDANSPLVRGLGKIKASYEEVAAMYEMRTKIVGFLMMKEKYPQASNAAIMHIIQERSGSPNFPQSQGIRQLEYAYIFYNPFMRGISSALDTVNGPKFQGDPSRRDFIFKTIAAVAATTIPGALLEFFGPEDIRDQFLAIPDSDKDNYILFPAGWADKDNWKVRMIRIMPVPHILRPVRAMVRNAIRAAALGDVKELLRIGDAVNYGADYLPGLNPIIFSVLPGLYDQFAGNVPKDRFGRDIYDPDFQGTPEAWMSFAHWALSEMGGSAIWRYYNNVYADPNPTWEENMLSKPIISSTIGRVYKVTNVGYKQKFARAKEKIQNEEAEVRRTIKRYMASGSKDKEIEQQIGEGFSVLFQDKSKWRDNLVRDKERYLSAYMAEYYQQQMKEQAIEQNTTHFERTMSEGIGGTGIDRATYLANPELIPPKYRRVFTP